MMYPYMILADETEIVHSHLIEEDNLKKVEVHFERAINNGFDVARCSLPTYTWIIREGFSDDEIIQFEQFLKSNAHLIYRFAERGGMSCA